MTPQHTPSLPSGEVGEPNTFPELQVAFDPKTSPEVLAALQSLVKKAETYRMRWLSCLTLEESKRIQDERAELKAALTASEAERERMRSVLVRAKHHMGSLQDNFANTKILNDIRAILDATP